MRTKSERDELIEQNLPLAKKYAHQYWLRYRDTTGLEFGDYLAWATLGLIHAVDHYDPSNNNTFGTYAYWCIIGQLKSGYQIFACGRRANQKALDFNGRQKRWPENYVAVYHDRPHESIDHKEQVQLALKCLGKRDRKAVTLHYIQGYNRKQTAKKMGLSTERVRQILVRAINRMRESVVATE